MSEKQGINQSYDGGSSRYLFTTAVVLKVFVDIQTISFSQLKDSDEKVFVKLSLHSNSQSDPSLPAIHAPAVGWNLITLLYLTPEHCTAQNSDNFHSEKEKK